MANEQNLIPQAHKLTVEEQSKAGKKSVEIRRQRKAMREQMEMLLTLPVKNENLKKKIKDLGIDKDDIDNQMALIISLYQTALKGEKNSVQAFNTILEMLDEKQSKDNVTQSLAETIQKAYESKGDK